MADARRRRSDLTAEFLGFDPFASVAQRYPDLYRPRDPSDKSMMLGGQRYREVDDGRANVLIEDPMMSPAEFAERQRAVRVVFMEDSPLAGGAYGVASLAGASPGARDAALVLGGLADVAGAAMAQRAAFAPEQAMSPRSEPLPPGWRRPDVRLRDVNANRQALGAAGTLTAPMIGSGAKFNRRLTPPGWQGNGDEYNEARGHLLGANLGGPGGLEERNAVTLTHHGANTPQMRNFEQGVARKVRGGEVMEYTATPLYNDGVLPPSHIVLTAHGSRGTSVARVIQNPAGRRR